MVAHEAPNRNPEKQINVPEIPKSCEIFNGDINDAVIAVQEITGFEITPEWWMSEVGNDGTTEDILSRFDNAFEKFVFAEMGIDSDEESGPNDLRLEPSEIEAEAESEMTMFDDVVTAEPGLEPLREEFLDALREHLEAKYFQASEDSETMEGDMLEFNLTTPESRLYTVGEDYRFLVHVPLNDVEKRASEIGHKRGKTKLMTSLISEAHQGTFLGQGGIIVAEPKEGSVSGVAQIDVGAEIQAGRNDGVDSVIAPEPPFEYNQIDVAFDGTEPIGVLIKQTPDGRQIGSTERNQALIQYAKQNNLPIVTVEVQPGEVITDSIVDVFELSEGQGEMVTIDIPYTDNEFIRSQVLRIGEQNVVYHSDGKDRVARTMILNSYGESRQQISSGELDLIVDWLKRVHIDHPKEVTDEDIQVIIDECRRLSVRD